MIQMKTNKIILGLLLGLGLSVFLLSPEVHADPTITGLSQSYIQHEQTLTLTGSGFGTKLPAAPLIWDNCEGKTINTPIAVISEGGWSERSPHSSANPNDWKMQYRSIPYRTVSGPHSRSSTYMAGGHYRKPNDNADCVLVTKDNGAHANEWYAIWYVKLDPKWPDVVQTGNNYKDFCCQDAPRAYSGPGFYTASRGIWSRTANIQLNITGHLCFGTLDADPTPSEYWDWRRQESIIRFNPGRLIKRTDNLYVSYDKSCAGNLVTTASGIQSLTIGGFGRNSADMVPGTGHNDMFRYFDDLYVDVTWARVMLANSSNYDSATIIEPQIPSAWSDNSITLTANLGKLPQRQTAYLFVFDSDNNHNGQGHPVTLRPAHSCPSFDDSNTVNFGDFSALAGSWLLSGPCIPGDFNVDYAVDMNDLVILSLFWLTDCYKS